MDRKIFIKACNFCVYQERTQDEVKKRLSEWKVFGDEAEEIIAELIGENFINEERFAKQYAGGKFRVKKWGKRKIRFELKARKISEYSIKAGLSEIDDEDYYETLKELIVKKNSELFKETNLAQKHLKISKYLIGKGYESNLIWDAIKEISL
jgi:regulatory protein